MLFVVERIVNHQRAHRAVVVECQRYRRFSPLALEFADKLVPREESDNSVVEKIDVCRFFVGGNRGFTCDVFVLGVRACLGLERIRRTVAMHYLQAVGVLRPHYGVKAAAAHARAAHAVVVRVIDYVQLAVILAKAVMPGPAHEIPLRFGSKHLAALGERQLAERSHGTSRHRLHNRIILGHIVVDRHGKVVEPVLVIHVRSLVKVSLCEVALVLFA